MSLWGKVEILEIARCSINVTKYWIDYTQWLTGMTFKKKGLYIANLCLCVESKFLTFARHAADFCKCIYACTNTYVYALRLLRVYIANFYEYIYACTNTYEYALRLLRVYVANFCEYIYACTYTYEYALILLRVYIADFCGTILRLYSDIYVYVYIHIYICLRVCVYTCICTQIF